MAGGGWGVSVCVCVGGGDVGLGEGAWQKEPRQQVLKKERSGQWCRFLFKHDQDVYRSKATEARETEPLIMIDTGGWGCL